MKNITIPICVLLLTFWGCQSHQPKSDKIYRYRQSRLSLGTIINLDICASTEQSELIEEAYKKAWLKIEQINQELNVYNKESDVARINGSYLKPVSVSPDTYRVVEKAMVYSRLTNGTFDITVLPLTYLWQGAERKNMFPSAAEIKDKKTYVGQDKIRLLPNNRVMLLHPFSGIDLGAIAPGYAADAVADIFHESGFNNFYIDTGGEIYASGDNCERCVWKVGIKHPRYANKIVERIGLHDQAVSTSGDYERYFIIYNEKWSHIINPITGYPQKGIVSATVIAPNTATADALATALCIMPIGQGLQLIDSLGKDYAAVIMELKGGQHLLMHKSRNYKDFAVR